MTARPLASIAATNPATVTAGSGGPHYGCVGVSLGRATMEEICPSPADSSRSPRPAGAAVTAARIPTQTPRAAVPYVSPIVDYEPPPLGNLAQPCPPPSPAALHRR